MTGSRRDLEFMQGSATEAEIEKFQLKRGQVIITKDSEGWDDIGIPALVTEDMPDVLCGYHLSVLEPGPDLDGAFLAWLCRSEPLNDQFKFGANGVTRVRARPIPDEERIRAHFHPSKPSDGSHDFWMRRRRGSTG